MEDKEHTRYTPRAMVVSTYPDVCKSPVAPVPYTIISKFDRSTALAESVRATDQTTFTKASQINGVIGDEGGTGLGVKSGTHADGGVCKATDWSPTVRAEGKNVVRHDDPFEMNSGNTQGKAVFPGKGAEPGEVDENGRPKKKQDPKDRSRWQKAKDYAKDLNNRYQLTTRAGGVAQMVGGTGEAVFGGGLMAAPEPVLTKIGGGVLFMHGTDNIATGWKQASTGVEQKTVTEQLTTETAKAAGASDANAEAIGKGVDGGLTHTKKLKTATDVASRLKKWWNGTRVSGPKKSGDTAPRRQSNDTD